MWRTKHFSLVVASTLVFAGQCFAQAVPSQPRDPGERPAPGQAGEQSDLVPEFLTKLNLTAQQEQQIREVMRTHNQKVEEAWAEFNQLHWQIVEFEAGLAAANALAGHDHAAHHEGAAQTPAQTPQRERQPVPPRQTSPQERGATERQAGQPARNFQPERERTENREASDPSAEEQPQIHIVGMRISLLEPNGVVRQVELEGNAPRHEAECEICAAHAKQLKTLWGKAHKLHRDLVNIESERMIAIESKLTEQQLKQLQSNLPPIREAQGERRAPNEAAGRNPETRKE